MSRESDYERLKAAGAGYCPCCLAVVTPAELALRPIHPTALARGITPEPPVAEHVTTGGPTDA
jgi:hypothetical protein